MTSKIFYNTQYYSFFNLYGPTSLPSEHSPMILQSEIKPDQPWGSMQGWRQRGAVAPSSGCLSPSFGEKFRVCRGIFDGKLCYNAQKDTVYSVI